MKERYQDVKKIEIKFMGKICVIVEYNKISTKLPMLITKKYSVGDFELLVVVWGLERFRFHLYGQQVQLFSDHEAVETLLKKKNKSNKQYSSRLTRWLDRLNHFDITLKYTAGKEIKVMDFITRNPTGNA